MAKADDMANARPMYLHTTRVSGTNFQHDTAPLDVKEASSGERNILVLNHDEGVVSGARKTAAEAGGK